ncbi:Chitobiase/beta-hexosaminidase C-terminal domain-containing protein [Micromonospora haikouensis]|uniref:Chitobiase/beta-hexosaminidase C-terminal domain-containing protein n=1 Tax=Micromonospora haikouensis TaxID=686309 RepID=A0A1C4U9B2_9ACTN|nr:Chitobiase/beta-hexosaminidase C-terminal domain-containing protein [Micromonospora haikouensis]
MGVMVRNLLAQLLGIATAISLAAVGGTAPVPAGAADVRGAPTAAADSPADLTGDIDFSVPSGTFQGELSVSLGTSVTGAEIRYTTDGTLPGPDSRRYDDTPLLLSGTTQLRARPFVGGAPAGDPGTALYVARAMDVSLDLPILVIDGYGKGKPGRDFVDSAALLFEPTGGYASLSATPTLATRIGYHLRGTSSSLFDKAPYRVEFRDNEDDDADYPVLGMPAESDWVLRGPYTDKALIREALTFDLARQLGYQAPRYAFVEFYLNVADRPLGAEDYQGVYMIVETIKNAKNRLDLKELDPDDVTLPAISGGYIFKFEWLTAEEPTLECVGRPATCWHYLEVVDPSPLQPEQQAWLTGHLQQFNDLMQSRSFADPTTGYPAWIDVGSFVDSLILNELTRNFDAYARSSYFYKDRGGKITAGPLWDLDITYGVGGGDNLETAGWQYEQPRWPKPNNWINRLVTDPAFVGLVRARWAELRRGPLSGAQLDARFAAITAPLVNAAERNFQRWPNLTTEKIGPIVTPTADTWQGQVRYMRDWMTERMAWLDSSAGWGGAAAAGG